MSARTGDPRKTLVPKTIMAESTNEVTLDDAGRNQISVSGVSGLAPSLVWGAGSGHCGKSSKHLRNLVLLIYLLGDKGVTDAILSSVAPHYRVVLLI